MQRAPQLPGRGLGPALLGVLEFLQVCATLSRKTGRFQQAASLGMLLCVCVHLAFLKQATAHATQQVAAARKIGTIFSCGSRARVCICAARVSRGRTTSACRRGRGVRAAGGDAAALPPDRRPSAQRRRHGAAAVGRAAAGAEPHTPHDLPRRHVLRPRSSLPRALAIRPGFAPPPVTACPPAPACALQPACIPRRARDHPSGLDENAVY